VFTHLHCHDEYSLLDGFGSPESYAKRAKELGMDALAITNHGNTDGLIKFQNACKGEGIRPIFGAELYIVPDIRIREKGEKRRHITILVENKTGWENLNRMITKSHLEGHYYRPRIDPDILLNHLEGLIILTACTSTFIQEEWGRELAKQIVSRTGNDHLYFEIMPHKYDEQIKINQLSIEMAEKLGCKVVATNDCHYVKAENSKTQEVMLAVQRKARWNDPNRWRFDVEGLYLKSSGEMSKAFKEQGQFKREIYIEAIRNTGIVSDMCKGFSEIEQLPTVIPPIPGLSEDDEFELKSLCEDGFKRKILSIPEKAAKESIYRERLDEELGTVLGQRFARYFLLVWELINWCENNDIMVGPGRGSSGGSLICYLLNITKVDPIEFKLVFARFISPARIDFPDIDMDFEDVKRDRIRQHLEDTYGKYNVAGVSTFMTLKGRGALRDVSRVFNVPLSDVNKGAASIVVRSGGDFRSDYTIEDAFETFEDGIAFKKKYPEVTRIAVDIEGTVKGKGTHAAAMVVTVDNLLEGKRAPLQIGKDGHHVVTIDKHDIEHVGLMKLDVLGLNALTVLNETKKLIKKNHKVDIIFEELPLDDPKCYEEFSKGNNTGCFQVGSLGLKRFCQQLGVENFDMLVHATSLYRPGTLRSGTATVFVKRKRGEESWESIHPIIEELTADTFGIILYQEQVMKFMYELGGLGWRTADTVRKVISKSQGVEQFQKFKSMFADGCVEKGTLGREEAEKLWEELSSFGSYGFNLSHAVEYSLISYWDMWCKVHYPEEFICCNLTYGTDTKEKKTDLLEEAIRIGLDVRPPKFGKSKAFTWSVDNNILYTPFIEIKGFGNKTATVAEKNFDSLPKRFQNIITEIKGFEDITIDEEEAERIAKYFSFSYSKDPSRKIKPIIEKLNIKIADIKDIDFNKPDKALKLYFGKMTEIKFGYRKNVQQNRQDIKGQAGDLGGVYGNFKDKDDFCMLVFGGEVYSDKKDLVEHSSDKFLIAKASNPNRTTSIHCSQAWFDEELFAGEVEGLDVSLAEQRRFKNPELANCEKCQLRQECSGPVLPETGKYNIMIIGEAPGKDENRTGKTFQGEAGKILFKEIEKAGLKRKDFNLTNVVKCHPSKTKTPSKAHINKCSGWLKEEIEKINPFIILALGNTNIKFFTEDDSGIMNKSGTTEWSYEYNCWICWCIHPASVLYSPENKKMFQEGIRNFTRKVKLLGGI